MSTPYLTNLKTLNHRISIQTAHDLIVRFDNNKASILAGGFSSQDPFVKSQTFEQDQIEELLAQPGCVALRAYLGMYSQDDAPDATHKGKIVLVLCGVDENGNDLKLMPNDPPSGQIILEVGQMCPPFCSDPSQINNL